MTTNAIITEALRLDAERTLKEYTPRSFYYAQPERDHAYLAHAANNYAAMCRRVRELEAKVKSLESQLANQGARWVDAKTGRDVWTGEQVIEPKRR